MDNVEYSIYLDLFKTGRQGVVRVTQNDTARVLCVSLTQDGKPYALSADATAVLRVLKPDGKVLYNACNIENGEAYYEFTAQTVSVTGTLQCAIIIYGADNKIISTPQFLISVSETVGTDEGIESTNEYTALTKTMSSLATLESDLETKRDSGYFKGEKGDDGVNGKDGVTPVKGVDYFTDSDIASLNIPVVDISYSKTSDNAQSGKAVAAAIAEAVGGITDFELDLGPSGNGYTSFESLRTSHPTGKIGTFYLVANPLAEANNAYLEYIWTGSDYEMAGKFGSVDTSDLASKQDLASAVSYASKTQKGTVRMWLVTDTLTDETTLNIATED